MYFQRILVGLLIINASVLLTSAWDNEELEIFDLVEEINKNFYEFMEISQNATSGEIKRAFRGLSIVLHPDKSSLPAEEANVQFRNLVSIYEVLKDPGKREKYNKVLKDGLPNWKSALYYYRRMRKVGLYEGALIVFIIISIGQYAFAWAAYLEKKYTAEQVFGSKLKKLQKKNKNVDIETILSEIPKPSILNTLPFQIPRGIWNLPNTIKNAYKGASAYKEMALENMRREAEEAKRIEELEKEQEEQARLRKEKKENLRRRKLEQAKAPEKTDEDLQGYSRIQGRGFGDDDAAKSTVQKTTVSGGFWTDEDLSELIRLIKKYPQGSRNRWETIADAMNRTVQEITFMAAKMKENGYRLPSQADNASQNVLPSSEEPVKIKQKVKKAGDKSLVITETNWTQEQQRALESAIVKYRKNANVGDRWQKIANCVPEKTKEECLSRYKYLCELVKSQKKADEEEEDGDQASQEEDVEEGNPPAEGSQTIAENRSEDEPVDENQPEANPDEMPGNEKGKKRNKRKERRRRRDFSSDEDSDNAYNYEMS